MNKAYYNEFDPKAAQWLRNLIDAGLIPAGHVDERSITEVTADDVRGYTQCHFFAGIGGWPLALQLAGWPAARPVWTGSCPCQPFSVAGRRAGTADERHLWPEFQRLIAQCSPSTVFGEQVASRLGRDWLAGVRADLEALGYAVGAADLCAAGVGAPHIRQRLYWMADAGHESTRRRTATSETEVWGPFCKSSGRSTGSGLPDSDSARPQGRAVHAECGGERSPWARSLGNWIDCADGKARRIEPGLEPLAHGVPARVVRLRGYGNAIVPQVAARFVDAYLDSEFLL